MFIELYLLIIYQFEATKTTLSTIDLQATYRQIDEAQDQHLYTPCLSDTVKNAPIVSVSQQ